MDKSKITAKSLSAEKRERFYQAKYNYYKSFNRGLLIVSTIAYLFFFLTDCGLYGRFAYETLFSRVFIIVPFSIFLFLYKKTEKYKIMAVASFLMIHAIIWCTDWATYILPNREFAGEGMLIMNLIFVCAGFCAPYKYCIVAHCALLVDILIANIFIQYDNVMMMLMFNVPCVVAVCIMHYTMENVFLDHYLVTEKLENLVVHDQLTGVFNRNKFKELSDSDTEEFILPYDVPLTLMIIDVDFFKKVNDKYGHEAGDIVLKKLAKVLSSSVRASDYVIRWGGEEFIVMLVGCQIEKGLEIAEKIRKNVEASDNKVCPVTVSIGVAQYKGGSYHSVIECADEALYLAKTSGRNQVVEYKKEE